MGPALVPSLAVKESHAATSAASFPHTLYVPYALQPPVPAPETHSDLSLQTLYPELRTPRQCFPELMEAQSPEALLPWKGSAIMTSP